MSKQKKQMNTSEKSLYRSLTASTHLKYTLAIAMLCLLLSGYSYGKNPDSTTVTVTYDLKSDELRDVLSLQNIDYFKVQFSDTSLRGKHFKLVSKEYRKGKLVATRDFFTETAYPAAFVFGEEDSVFQFRFICHQPEKKLTHFLLRFDRVGLNPTYSSTKTNLYSLRDATGSLGEPVKVPLQISFPLFVYSLPYIDPKKPNLYQYCALTQDGVPPAEWGKKYGVKHYVVFELQITD